MTMSNTKPRVTWDANEAERRRREIDALAKASAIRAMEGKRTAAAPPPRAPGAGVNRVPVTVRELAERLKMERSACRRYVLSLGYRPVKQRTASSGFQEALTLTPEQADEIYARRHAEGYC